MVTAQKADRLVAAISRHRRVIVAFSGGVDSSVVAAAAARSGAESVLAVTADSPSVARWQLETARQIACEIGIEHQVIQTSETTDSRYVRNDSRRCFYCKQTLYNAIRSITRLESDATIMSGTNADDLGDYRPGIEAGDQVSVVTPLADLGWGKQEIREMARYFGLSNAELAASPCLASRLAYGVSVTPERLSRVERAESYLRELDFGDLRVRLHENDLARIEVSPDEVGRFADADIRLSVERFFRELGFQYVTIDLAGLRSGSMNRTLVNISGASK